MKAALKQLNATDADRLDSESDQADTLEADTAGSSGLADFEASFGGDTWRQNRSGTVNEAGHVQYRLSQTTTENHSTGGRRSGSQTVEEQLSADFKKAPGDAMLFVTNGNFSATKIRDTSTETTLIDAAADGHTRVLLKTDSHHRERPVTPS